MTHIHRLIMTELEMYMYVLLCMYLYWEHDETSLASIINYFYEGIQPNSAFVWHGAAYRVSC